MNGVYRAADYHELADAMTFVGRYSLDSLQADGKWIRIAVWPAADYTPAVAANIRKGVSKMAPVQNKIMGGAPYDAYTIFFNVIHEPVGFGGGLEHSASQYDIMPAGAFADPAGTLGDFMYPLISHEFFHLWNVKRIRPAEMWPYDYHAEQYTPLLWWSEGVTDYYADLILARAGLETPADFAQGIATSIGNHRDNPARLRVSPERSSWTVWDSPAVNDSYVISYYLQGELLGFLLDLAIRDSSDNTRSLDDVMRHLASHYSGAHGFTKDDLVESVTRTTGHDFAEFWRRYVSGVDEIPWNDYLRAAGWEVAFSEEQAVDARIGSIPPAVQGGRWRAVATPGSAAAAAGLRTGDELVRINGRQIIDGTDVTAVVRAARRNMAVAVDVVRDGQPLTIRFHAGSYQRVRARLHDLPAPTEKMRRIRARLLHP